MTELNIDYLDRNSEFLKRIDLKELNLDLPQFPSPKTATRRTIPQPAPVQNEPPSWPKRALCNLGIGLFSALVYQYEWWEAGWFYLFGKNATRSQLKKVLADLVENGDTELTAQVLDTYLKSKTKFDSDDAVLADILNYEATLPQLHEIFKGANVRLYGDGGATFEKWASLPTAYTRWTSHDAKLGKSRGLTGSFIHELHFWIDRKTGDTVFQVEKHPMTGPLWGLKNGLNHMIDYFRYVRDDLQQSTYGASPHTDRRPIIIDTTRSK